MNPDTARTKRYYIRHISMQVLYHLEKRYRSGTVVGAVL